MEIAKERRAFEWKLLKFVFQKHASTFDVAMVTKGGEAVER